MHVSAQSVLAGIALVGLIGLSFVFAFVTVPKENHDFMIYVLGTLSGALTVGGVVKAADKITNSIADKATIQTDAGGGQ